MEGERGEDEVRILTTHGEELKFHAYPEVKDAVMEAVTAYARRRRRGDAMLEGFEESNKASVLNRLVCWWLSLRDEDRDRIQVEGEELYRRTRELPASYSGGLPFPRRTESVFSAGKAVGVGGTPVKPGPARRRGGSGNGHEKPARKDQAAGQDVRP